MDIPHVCRHTGDIWDLPSVIRRDPGRPRREGPTINRPNSRVVAELRVVVGTVAVGFVL